MVEIRDRCAAMLAPRRGREQAMTAALHGRFGLDVPGMNRFTQSGGLLLTRTAPHQLLAMRDEPGLFQALDEALGEDGGVIDLSDARTGVIISGPGARDRLMRLLPIDVHESVLHQGVCAQTVMAHLTVLVLQLDDTPTFELQCAASYRDSFLRAVELG